MPKLPPRHLAALSVLVLLALACRSPSPQLGAGGSEIADRIAIAVLPFRLAPGTSPPPVDVAELLRGELAASGRFTAIAEGNMPPPPAAISELSLEDLRRRGVDQVVVGVVARVHDGGHEVEFHLVDARSEASLVAFMVPSAPDALPQTAREIADIIRQRLLGDAGTYSSARPPHTAGDVF